MAQIDDIQKGTMSIKTHNTKRSYYEKKRNSVRCSPHWNGRKYIERYREIKRYKNAQMKHCKLCLEHQHEHQQSSFFLNS